MQILKIGGRQIEFRFEEPPERSGSDIVMLHEGLGSAAMWRNFPKQLAAATGRRTLVYSRFGYGRSTPLSAPRGLDYMHEEAAVWLPAIIDRLEIETPVLFGHSDGASIALIHAAQRQSKAAAVIALAPHVNVEDVTVASIGEVKSAYESADLRVRLSRYHSDVDSAFWGWNRIWLDPAFRSWNIEALLPSIRCPVLAMQGEQDEYGTMLQLASIDRAVDDATILAISQCKHSPHRDQPETVLDATRAFLREAAQSGRPPRPAPPTT